MKKIDLNDFRELKKKILNIMDRFQEEEDNDEYISDEEEEQLLSEYRGILKTLTQYDLSDIDFEEWRGIYLFSEDDSLIDFSKTKANIDFSIIDYYGGNTCFCFKSCQIKNFDFEKYRYTPEMFDEEFRKENNGRFLSENISKEVAERFYNGELTLTDITNNPELANKIEEKNLEYGLKEIYGIIGREEFCKLDAQFIDMTRNYKWTEVLNSNPNLRTAEEIMPVFYKTAREGIIGFQNDDSNKKFYYKQYMLGDKFRLENPDLFLSADVPERVRQHYYGHSLSLKEFSENLQHFEGKKVAHSFRDFEEEKKLIGLYGEEIYNLFLNYKPIMDNLLVDYYTMDRIEVPTGPITDEQRKEIMSSAITNYINRNGYEQIRNWDEFLMLLDFIPLQYLPATPTTREIIEKYGIDKIIASGLDIKYLFHDTVLSNVEEIANLRGIELEDIKKLVDEDCQLVLEKYDAKQLLEYGIKELSELYGTINDLHQIKKLLEERPMDLINMGSYGEVKKKFIEKYGIDNIITLDEETKGIFSHSMWSNNIYLTLFAHAEKNAPKFDSDKELTYEEFKNRMYEILLHARDEKGPLRSRDYPDYDFIQGDFREEHPDIFIDGDIPDDVKKDFYTSHMTAENVRLYPQLIQILQGKDLSRTFPHKMTVGFSLVEYDKNGNIIGGAPKTVNMAEYLSEKIGQEEFLKICADYGECLDNIGISINGEITIENLREVIEESIYDKIKEKGLKYFEDLPLSFHEKHPELFLPKEIDENIRTRFCEGHLSFGDIKKNSQIKDLLLTKDLSVGFGKIKYGQQMLSRKGQRYIRPMWEKLTEKEILDLAEAYGEYLRDVDNNVFLENQNYDENLIKAIEENIENNILNRKSMFFSGVPLFFKEKYPSMFLDDNAPDELKYAFYDNGRVGRKIFREEFDFYLIKENPQWKKFLQGKDLSRAFSEEYSELFKRFDSSTLLKIGTRNPETIEKMVQNHKEDILENWYKSTGGKFVPHHVVMLNFPVDKIDSFLGNSKKWSQLMKIENHNLNDDGKAAILKAAYAMGVFQGNDDGFNITMKLFTDIPQELSPEEHDKVIDMLGFEYTLFSWNIEEQLKETFESAYKRNDEGKYVLSIDKQKNKNIVKNIRGILEKAQLPRIITPEKAHQIFDSFAMEYNPDFVKFFTDNIEEILTNPEYTKDIATIQRQFKDIVRTNAGRRLTLDVAQDYIRSIAYTDIDIGNEGIAEQAKIVGYSQKDFEEIQKLFNEGETREFSSIPRIQGKTEKGYTYEMLRCDDPLALTIGTLTDCCQEIHGAGQTSMEHSVVSLDGRVFCVRDSEGRLVAQSWFWRNQYTGCFDNIEIPHRIFELYEREHPDIGRKGLTVDVLEVYKKAAQDLMQEDAKVYQELLDNGTITEEQYNALLLGKVTIGLGYNDIADAIQSDKTIHLEADRVGVKGTERLPHPYTDASKQYTIAEREGITKSEYENLYVHQDDISVYDITNMSSTVLLTMKRMEQTTARDNLAYLRERSDEENLPKSQRIINSIARVYGLEPSDTKIMATARIALIYSKDNNNNIKIAELLSSPLKKGLTEEQKSKATAHIRYQIKKAVKQIGLQDSKFDLESLNEEQQQLIQSVMQEIEKENSERGEI